MGQPRDSREHSVRAFLEGRPGQCFCEQCLARGLGLDVLSARLAMLRLTWEPSFWERQQPCDGCGRHTRVIYAGRPRRSPRRPK